MILDDRYYKTHLLSWAHKLEEEYGYPKAQIVVFLRELAEVWDRLVVLPEDTVERINTILAFVCEGDCGPCQYNVNDEDDFHCDKPDIATQIIKELEGK